MMSGYLRMNEVAELAGLTVGTAYQYHAGRLYDFPEHHLKIGQIKFWKRSTAAAWARKHRKRIRR